MRFARWGIEYPFIPLTHVGGNAIRGNGEESPSASPDFPVREFFQRFPDEQACLEHIMAVRFGGTTLDCPSCGAEGQFHKLRDRRAYACPSCLFQIAPTANTVLHDTRTPLVSWFYACICSARRAMA